MRLVTWKKSTLFLRMNESCTDPGYLVCYHMFGVTNNLNSIPCLCLRGGGQVAHEYSHSDYFWHTSKRIKALFGFIPCVHSEWTSYVPAYPTWRSNKDLGQHSWQTALGDSSRNSCSVLEWPRREEMQSRKEFWHGRYCMTPSCGWLQIRL